MKTYAGENTLSAFSGIVKRAIAEAGGDTTNLVRAPVGTIVIWSGTADNIPTCWQFCDGTNGTPDLRDKFVLGAGTAHSVGETGGSEEVTLTIEQMPRHSHIENIRFDGNAYGPISGVSTVNPVPTYQIKESAKSYINPGVVGAMQTGETGKSSPHSNMPPYYALCYIMKLTADETDGVVSINEETGAITLKAGDNVSITKTGKTITISATGGGTALPTGGTTGQALLKASDDGVEWGDVATPEQVSAAIAAAITGAIQASY